MNTIEEKIKLKRKKAEDLRLEGNDAFSTKDWERAEKKYQESIKQNPESAKTYSNLAATLCKLGKYQEAEVAAKRATIIDGKWAKGWWRRGIVAELMKDPFDAVTFFSCAVELDPKNKVFKSALDKANNKVIVSDNDNSTGESLRILKKVSDEDDEIQIPTKNAFLKVKRELGNPPTAIMMRKYQTIHKAGKVTSEQYLLTGFAQWVCGVQSAAAALTLNLFPQAQEEFQLLQTTHERNRGSLEADEIFCRQCEDLLGGVPENSTDSSFASLVSGMGHLGGNDVFLESIDVVAQRSNGRENCYVPPSRFFPDGAPVHFIACYGTIHDCLMKLLFMVQDDNVVLSNAVVCASYLFSQNLQLETEEVILKRMKRHPSPKIAVRYMKKLLQNGLTWDTGVRRYCGLMYRGSMLYGLLTRLMMGPNGYAQAYKAQKWAIDFIAVADQEFKVTKNKSYHEMGASFRNSLRIGLLMSFSQTHEVLRGGAVNGPYSMETSLDILIDISNMANSMTYGVMNINHPEYSNAQSNVGMVRKPLAMAHSSIASILTTIESIFSLDEFIQIAVHHGFIKSNTEYCDPFAIIAEHYKIAAENELEDNPDSSIYWYGYAANMCRADVRSGYTIGQVRNAMENGRAANEARDISIFGVEKNVGTNTLEILSKIVLEHFSVKDDSFILPKVDIDRRNGGQKALLKVGDLVLCKSFEDYEKVAIQLEYENQSKRQKELDNKDAMKKYGQTMKEIPSLELLCIRTLHKEGADFAKGESDGSVIQHKAMMMALAEEEEEKKSIAEEIQH